MTHIYLTFQLGSYKFAINSKNRIARCYSPDFTFSVDNSISLPTKEDQERRGGEEALSEYLATPNVRFASLQDLLLKRAKDKELSTTLIQLSKKFGIEQVTASARAMTS